MSNHYHCYSKRLSHREQLLVVSKELGKCRKIVCVSLSNWWQKASPTSSAAQASGSGG